MDKRQKPPTLFDTNELLNWKPLWEGMPEFDQPRLDPYAQLIIRFENAKDLEEFSKLIGQKINKKTKSCWFPFKSHWGNTPNMRWVDEP